MIAVVFSSFSYAQSIAEKKFDLRINYGLFSDRFIKEAKSNKLSVLEIPILGPLSIKGSGILSAEILRQINRKFQAGVSFSYQKIKINDGIYGVQYRLNNFSVLPSFYYNYHFTHNGFYYLGGSVGCSFLNYKMENYETLNNTKFSYQATLFGLRFGNKYALITEIGYGCKGIFQLGFSYKP